MNIIFQIEGGLGKSILGTAIVKVIRRHYEDANIIVVTHYPEVFLNNPYTYKVYHFNNINGFYLKYIKDYECKIFIEDPYKHSNFLINKSVSILKTWCELFNLNYLGELPQIYITQPEADYFVPYYKTEKPIFVIQPNGGPAGLGYSYTWTRDIPEPTILDIINHYKNDYAIIHVKREDQKTYPDTFQALDNYRSIAVLFYLSKKRLLIDSFSQHLAASLNLKSTVCWVATKPEIFGYEMHDNIKANSFTKEPVIKDKAYQPFELSENIHSIPYNNLKEIFNINHIIESINNQ